MAKDFSEIYGLIEKADKANDEKAVQELFAYIDAESAKDQTYDPRELSSGLIPAGSGAAAAALATPLHQSGISAIQNAKAASASPTASVTVQGMPAASAVEEATTKGLSNEVTQQTRTAQRAARTEQSEKILRELQAKGHNVNPKILAEMEAQYARPGSGVLIPVERARELEAAEAARKTAAAALPENATFAQKAIAKALPQGLGTLGSYAKGIYDYKLPFIGSVGSLLGRGLAGAGAGLQAQEAYNLGVQGDDVGKYIGYVGAAGTGASALPLPGPVRAIGAGVGLSAEAINAYRKAMREGRIQHGTPENYENTTPAGDMYATGGSVYKTYPHANDVIPKGSVKPRI